MNNTSFLILISTFTNALLKSKVVFVNIINALWTNVNYQWTTVFSLTLTKMNKYCNKCIVHCSLMLVNTLMKSYCIVLPYKCIGLQIGYVYLHRCMCHYINISPKSSSNTKFLTSEYFPPSLPPHQRHYVHRIYVFMNFQVIVFLCGRSVFFCYLAKISYYKRFSASHKLFGCDSTTNAP